MKIFKPVTDNDRVYQKTDDQLTDLFTNAAHLKKTADGWSYVKNSSFDDEPSITASIYFVENNSFYVAYANETSSTDYESFLPWNSLMSSLGANWNSTHNRYDFYVDGSRITEAVVISFNPDRLKEGMDDDNFFICLSGSVDTDFTDLDSNGNYNVSDNLVLAPYYLKRSINDAYSGNDNEMLNSNKMNPVLELRTSTDDTFLTYDEDTQSISINWNVGEVSDVMGYLYSELGLIVLFPELFTNANVKNTIQSEGDRALFALNSIMYIAGYVKEKISKEVIFSRLYHNEFNYTTNPSAYSLEGGELVLDGELERNPTVYITSIGYYNDKNECLAVASLSQPYEKSITNEFSLRVEIEL